MERKRETREILVVIPARGGSKGIPNKNIKLLNGKPLIHYTIEAARKLFPNNRICVSTDSVEIKKTAEQLGLFVPFLRPYELASDEATTESVLRHALNFYENQGLQFNQLLLLQPTSPFRRPEDITGALKKYHNDVDMVVSVFETKSNPYYVLFEEDKAGFLKKCLPGQFTRRQDCPKVYEYNGSFYLINVEKLKTKGMQNFDRVVKYEIPALYSIDIDDSLDWDWAEFIGKKYHL